MIIKIPSKDIPQYWDVIKYAAISTDGVSKEDQQSYLLDLLFGLFNYKYTCLVSFGKERKIRRLMIVAFVYDESTNRKKLYIRNLFAFEKTVDDKWLEEVEKIYELAKKEGCSSIETDSGNKKIHEIAALLGFKETSRHFSVVVGG